MIVSYKNHEQTCVGKL